MDIENWRELVFRNKVFQNALSKLIREDCKQEKALASWEDILGYLADSLNDPFALIARSRYYLDVANDSDFKDGRSFLKKARADIKSCLEMIDIHSWLEDSRHLNYDFHGLVLLPYRVIFHNAGSLYGLSNIKIHHKKALECFGLYQRCLMIESPAEQYQSLLSFRRYSEFVLSDLIEKQLTVMPPRVMNDCIDSLFFPWAEYHEKTIQDRIDKEPNSARKKNLEMNLKVRKFLHNSMKYYRIRAFVKPSVGSDDSIQNPLMWAHYANEHKGLAILYSFKSEEFCHVDKDQVWKFNRIHYAQKDEKIDISKDKISITEALLTKSYDWEYENEVRLLSYDTSIEDDYKPIKIGTIKAVYFGIRCPKQTIDTIKSLLEGYREKVVFYKMRIDEHDIYKLKTEIV